MLAFECGNPCFSTIPKLYLTDKYKCNTINISGVETKEDYLRKGPFGSEIVGSFREFLKAKATTTT